MRKFLWGNIEQAVHFIRVHEAVCQDVITPAADMTDALCFGEESFLPLHGMRCDLNVYKSAVFLVVPPYSGGMQILLGFHENSHKLGYIIGWSNFFDRHGKKFLL